MNALRLTLLVSLGLLSLPALADNDSADAARRYHDGAISAVRAKLASASMAARSDGAKSMGSDTGSGTPLANEYRAYPPSCAAWPLPDKASGTTVSKRVALYTRNANGDAVTPETVTVTVWRVPCSSSGNDNLPYNTDGKGNAMTLMRIDRDIANEGHTDQFPTFPLLNVEQGDIGFDDDESVVRAASEPNTFVTDGPYDSPIIVSTTYVLENYNYGANYNHQYNYAFDLAVDPYIANQSATEFTLGDYTGSGLSPMPFDGYAAKQWIATNHGLLVQVTEQQNSSGATFRQLVTDLEIQNASGNSEWLFANKTFAIGDTSVIANLNYRTDASTLTPWGTAKYVLLDCYHLDVTYTPKAGLPADAPGQGLSGTVHYNVLFNANGMVCE